MLVTIIGPNLRDQSKGDFHIHAAGCADIARNARRDPAYREGWTVDVDDRVDVTINIYPESDFGWDPRNESDLAHYSASIHYFPCAAALPAK